MPNKTFIKAATSLAIFNAIDRIKDIALKHDKTEDMEYIDNMFIMPKQEELDDFKPNFTVYNACKTVNKDWEKHGLNSEVFVVFNIEENTAIIGGTWYAGEMKKGIFSVICSSRD